GSDSSIRGLSKEKVCVFTACDRSNQDIQVVAGRGPVRRSWLKTNFLPVIAKDAVLVTDGHKSYQFIEKEKMIEHIVVKDEPGKRVLGSYHIQHINSYHHRLRAWINYKFNGVASKYLTHYLAWRHELEKRKRVEPIDLLGIAIGQINH
ncbi:MAG: IS1595 family transposase, partial [Proteobacteria bacterium]|nr:IS1595 family transposase [Pseudomonadota bacterium]